MVIKQKIQNDIKLAMKAGESEKLAVLRFLWAGIRKKEIDDRKELDNTQVIELLLKMIKNHNEAIEAYRKGQRQDLVSKEEAEALILKSYLPPQISEEELKKIIKDVIQQIKAASIKDMGKVMNLLKPQLVGKADLGKVAQMVKDLLGT